MAGLGFAFEHVRRHGLRRTLAQVSFAFRRGGPGLVLSKIRTAEQRLRERELYGLATGAMGTYVAAWREAAKKWAVRNGVPVTVVIPSYRDHRLLGRLLDALVATTATGRYRVVIADDCSNDPEQAAFLARAERQYDFLTVVRGEVNGGFAANVNRGLAGVAAGRDVVLMNSDVVPLDGWLAGLQYGLHLAEADIVAPKLLYPDQRIQFCGGYRNIGAPEWFDHLYRFQEQDALPATVPKPVLFATGAVLYVTAKARERLGGLDPAFPMGFEDVDYCLRCWQSGGKVMVEPRAVLEHHESATRGTRQGDREMRSLRHFWDKNADFFVRRVGEPGCKARVIFVTQDAGVGGGHRVVFRHLGALARAGYACELWNLHGPPDWYTLDPAITVRSFPTYARLQAALRPIDAIKVATWWETAEPVWLASITNGVPVYLVQDIESSYYRNEPTMQARALASYRPEFNYLANTAYLRDQLRALFGLESTRTGLGYDDRSFHAEPHVPREARLVLIAARGEPLKNTAYAFEIVRLLRKAGWRAVAFGLDAEMAAGEVDEFVLRPDDAALRALYCRATLFLSTSVHEGFALPPIEAMACGCLSASTDAVGNREYFRDGVNGIAIPHGDAEAAAARIVDTVGRPAEVEALRRGGLAAAAAYRWEQAERRVAEVIEAIAARPEYGRPVVLSDAK